MEPWLPALTVIRLNAEGGNCAAASATVIGLVAGFGFPPRDFVCIFGFVNQTQVVDEPALFILLLAELA